MQTAKSFSSGAPVNWRMHRDDPSTHNPPEMCCHTLVEHNNRLILFGGGMVGKTYSIVSAFDIETQTWSKLNSGATPMHPRLSHSAVVIGDYMYIYGGISLFRSFNDLWRYDLVNEEWEPIESPTAPTGKRRSHSAVVYEGKMYVLMGCAKNNYRDMWVYDPATNVWAEMFNHTSLDYGFPALGLAGHSAIVRDDNMYIFGGVIDSSPPMRHTNKVHRYNFSSGSWIEYLVPSTPSPSPRYASIIWMVGDHLHIHGGDAESCTVYFNDVWSLDVSKEFSCWKTVEQTGSVPCRRSGHAAVVKDGILYSYGGECPCYEDDSMLEYSGSLHTAAIEFPTSCTLVELASRWLGGAVASKAISFEDLKDFPVNCKSSVAKFYTEKPELEVMRSRIVAPQ